MQEHNTEGKTIGEIQERNTTEKITENGNRAHNNRIDTDRIGKAIPITPYFSPQRHEKIHR